jgi:hypothetical protein
MLGTNQNNTVTDTFASPVNAPVCQSRSVSCARGDVTTEEVKRYDEFCFLLDNYFCFCRFVVIGRGIVWC